MEGVGCIDFSGVMLALAFDAMLLKDHVENGIILNRLIHNRVDCSGIMIILRFGE